MTGQASCLPYGKKKRCRSPRKEKRQRSGSNLPSIATGCVASRRARIWRANARAVGDPGSRTWVGTSVGITNGRLDFPSCFLVQIATGGRGFLLKPISANRAVTLRRKSHRLLPARQPGPACRNVTSGIVPRTWPERQAILPHLDCGDWLRLSFVGGLGHNAKCRRPPVAALHRHVPL